MFLMKGIVVYRRVAITISVIVLCIFLLSTCINNSGTKEKTDNKAKKIEGPDFKKFAGSEVCASCHKDIYDKHIYTEHHLTSRLPLEKNILGSFENGKNVFVFDPYTNFNVTMEKRDSGFYQVEYNNDLEIRNGRFDVVIGSGRKGQS